MSFDHVCLYPHFSLIYPPWCSHCCAIYFLTRQGQFVLATESSNSDPLLDRGWSNSSKTQRKQTLPLPTAVTCWRLLASRDVCSHLPGEGCLNLHRVCACHPNCSEFKCAAVLFRAENTSLLQPSCCLFHSHPWAFGVKSAAEMFSSRLSIPHRLSFFASWPVVGSLY